MKTFFKTNILNLHQVQKGAISLYVSLMFMMVLSLVTLTFATIITRSYVQAQENRMHTQARYAAETAINDVRHTIQKDLNAFYQNEQNEDGSSIDQSILDDLYESSEPEDSCPSEAQHDGWSNGVLDKGETVRYQCVVVNVAPEEIIYDDVRLDRSLLLPLKAVDKDRKSVNLDSLTISWNQPRDSNAPYENELKNNDFMRNEAINDDIDIWRKKTSVPLIRLQITLYDESQSLERELLIDNTKVFFLYPTNYDTSNEDSYVWEHQESGSILGGACSSNKDKSFVCSVKLTELPLLNGEDSKMVYFTRIQTIYYNARVKIKGGVEDNSVTPSFRGIQGVIRATGRAGHILARLEERIPLQPIYDYPEYGLDSASHVCKIFISSQSEGAHHLQEIKDRVEVDNELPSSCNLREDRDDWDDSNDSDSRTTQITPPHQNESQSYELASRMQETLTQTVQEVSIIQRDFVEVVQNISSFPNPPIDSNIAGIKVPKNTTYYTRYLTSKNTTSCTSGDMRFNYNDEFNKHYKHYHYTTVQQAYYYSLFPTHYLNRIMVNSLPILLALKERVFTAVGISAEGLWSTSHDNIPNEGYIKNPLDDLKRLYINQNYIHKGAPYYGKSYYDVYLNILKDLDDYIVGYCFSTKNPQTNEYSYVFQALDLKKFDYITNNYKSNYNASEFKNPTVRKQEILDDIAQVLGLTDKAKRILNSIESDFYHYEDFSSDFCKGVWKQAEGCWVNSKIRDDTVVDTIFVRIRPIWDHYSSDNHMSTFVHEFLHAVFDYDLKNSSDRNVILKELIKLYFETDEWRHRFEPNVYKQFFTVKLEDKDKVLKWLDENDNLSLEDYAQIGFHGIALTELYASAGINIFADISGDDYNNPILYNHYSKYFKDWKGLGRKLYSYEYIEQSNLDSISNKLADYVLRGHH